ncbi:hypothetical protein F5X68DRAFT_207104 [Plectosphaerella plurivora]|uniref:Uncharacterized protein n=1 Tax=Plectosphaerella plurivora TaxID=936078 RepID=A0A9P8VCP1_9PEZI|nr:hypothetical protein F5X68DRAFT_207104 [Plectosphaerella plurivora]
MPRLSTPDLSDVVSKAVTAVTAATASLSSSSISPSSAEPEEDLATLAPGQDLKRKRAAPGASSGEKPAKKLSAGAILRMSIVDGPPRPVPCAACVHRIINHPGHYACYARIGTRGLSGRSCSACSRAGRKCAEVPHHADAPTNAARLAEAARHLHESRGTAAEASAAQAFTRAVISARSSLQEARYLEKEAMNKAEATFTEGLKTHLNARMELIEDEGSDEDDENPTEDQESSDDDCEEELQARARLRELRETALNNIGRQHPNGTNPIQPGVPAASGDDDLAKAVFTLAKSAYDLSIAAANVAELLRNRSQG